MNTILVPTDFSGSSQNALNFALLIAKSLQAGIVLLHVYPPTFDFASRQESYESHQEHRAEEKFNQLLDRIKQRDDYSHLDIRYEVRKGELVNEIQDTASEQNADLIIMGTLGAGGIKRIIGSNTSETVRIMKLPVLVVPANFRPDKVKRVVFATDLKHADVNVLSTLSPIVTHLNLPMEVVHVFEDKMGPEEELYEAFAISVKRSIPAASITFHKINNQDVEKGLSSLVSAYNDVILVLTVYKKDFFEKLLGESISEDIVLSGTTPVLIVKTLSKED